MDLHRFREIAAAARGSRDDDQASAHYREGLQLWRGEAFADLASPWLDRMSQTLRRERLTAELKRNDIELRRGRYAGLLSSLASLAQSHPLDERVTGQIMLAAYLNGRQADALGYYQQTRRRLIGELGIEPGPDLRELHQKILRGEADATPSGSVASREPRSLVPRQLPHHQVHFTGRRDELRRLDALNADSKADAKRVTSRRRHIVLITGPGGVGKTALAVHFGHAAASQFPDGQLYVDLRGYDPRQPKLSAGEVLGRFLRAFDIEPERIPVNIDERAALFRTVVAGKSVLVVLDNAASPEQIRPLLPGHHGCLVVVTSRNRLAGLAARDDASRIPLSVLPPGDAVALLSATIGGERFTTEPGAAAELAHLCGYLPLALRVAAERVAAEPSRAIGELLHDLSDQHRRLDGLGAEGDEITGVRLAFCWSFRAISGDAARVFRLLGVHATAEISVPAAAALADLTLADCRNVLATLADQHLLESAAAGRFAMHDLLRIYAAERAVAEERPDECAAATRRVLSWYLHAADAATRVLAPRHPHVQLNPPDPCHPPPVFATHDQALDWCITEHTNLIAAVRQAMDTGELAVAWELPVALFGFFYLTKRWAEWIAMLQIGPTAARRGGDRHAEAWVAGSLGLAYWDLKDFKSARHHMKQALALCREAADQRGESLALTSLGLACRDLGHPDEALEYLQQALDLYRLTGDLWGRAWALNNIGLVYRDLGHPDEALEYLQQALDLFRQTGDLWGRAWALNNIGLAYSDLGQLDEALDHLRPAAAERMAIHDKRGGAETRCAIADALDALGQHDEARALRQQAHEILDMLGGRHSGDIRARPSRA